MNITVRRISNGFVIQSGTGQPRYDAGGRLVPGNETFAKDSADLGEKIIELADELPARPQPARRPRR